MQNKEPPRIDYTNKDYASIREALLALAREKLPEWTDHSPNDPGVVLLELFSYAADIQLYYLDRIANESYLETAVERRSIVNLLRLIGCELRPAQPASVDLTLDFDPKLNQPITIKKYCEFKANLKNSKESVSFCLMLDTLKIELTDLEDIYETKDNQIIVVHKRYKTLPVVQVDQIISDEIIGSSDGSANQRFPLAKSPLIADSLDVFIDNQKWKQVSSLLYSKSDTHYIIRHDENGIAWIEFGDGMYGAIPSTGHNNVKASYGVGGGIKGNLPPSPNTVFKPVSSIDNLAAVFNQYAASGGMDAESVESAVRHGPGQYRSMGRAVTAADYETHAKTFGVGKVRARASGWNRVELVVAPAGGGYPSDTLAENLRNYFEDKRPVTTVVEIVKPKYIGVYLEGVLEIQPYLFTDKIRQQVQDAVKNLLAFENVKFECKLHISKFYEAIEAIEGVSSIYINHFDKLLFDSKKPNASRILQESGFLAFGYDEIPQIGYPEGIRLEVTGGRSGDY